jgi:Tol biopolymer transport system component/DNA-binding winged helix-turn-helix (wHTH) protein
MNGALEKKITFAEFELDTIHRRLLRDGEAVVLNAKAFDLLAFLANNNGRIVTKDEILHSVWDDKFVEEANLVVQISNLRKALGEPRNAPRFLVTVPGKGYKFVAETQRNGNDFVVETHTISELTIKQEEEIYYTNSYLTERVKSNWKWLSIAAVLILTTGTIGWFWSKPAPSINPKQVKLTKLTTSGKVFAAAMSPDGNFAVFSQKEDTGESLWLRQLDTGSEKRIVEPQTVEYVGLTISPDSRFIYASVFSKNEIDPLVQKIPLLGGVSQQIPNVATGSSISISPDGKRFAFTTSNNKENETLFGVSDIDGANSRFLIRAKHAVRYLSMFKTSPVAWSPDGAEIALAVHEKGEKNAGSAILMVNPDDGSERYLTEKRWKDIDYLTWLDADKLAFIASEENGLASQVWVFSRQTGEAKRLTNELQKYNWLAATGGKLLTVQLNASSSLRIADFNEAEKSLKIREIFTASEYVDEMDWDAGGGIIFASRTSGTSELWRMKTDGTNRAQLTSDANVTFGLTVSPMDGSLIFASKQNGRRGIWQTDSDGKNLRQLSEGGDQAPDVSSNGKVVFHRGIGYAEGIFLTSQNETAPRMLREKCYFPAISPDGEQAACYFMDLEENRKWRIALVSTDSGALIRKINLPLPIYERQIRFHPNGKFITQIFTTGENLNLLLLPLDGGEAQIINNLGKGASNLPEWSPDGKQFLYPVITERQDAVLLTDF